ncbi:hypothetical protein VTL71DRAFT_16511 [Oculimacula yallundae]|uniref:F-box domain-containing protein n=1 Tax=Oculimacula yallundae TaxID=86028 RepID=A0ABR4CER8_9HELO
MAVHDLSVRPTNLARVTPLGGTIAPQSSPLASIPLELLLQINRHLTTPEYGNLRLTCKHIEDQLLNAFTKEFFQKRQFMFTEFSLQALLDISKSRFATSLKHVIFGLEQPPMNPPSPRNPIGVVLSLSESVERENRIMTNWLDHATFLGTGQNVEVLAQAFSYLSRLETVGLRDFSSRSRFRDFPNVHWNSYGVSTYHQETGLHLQNPGRTHHPGLPTDHAMTTHRMFQDILRAAGKASLRLQNFEIILRDWALLDRAFNIPTYLQPTIDPVIANLRTLFLDLHHSYSVLMSVVVNGTSQLSPSYFLMRFLSRMSLNRYWPSYGDIEQLFGLLVCTKSHSLNKDDVPADERINLWAKFFNDLAGLDLKLEGINMSVLHQQQPNICHRRLVTFKESPNPVVKIWAGNDTQSGLRDFETLVHIQGLNDADTDIESSNEDDDEEHSDDSMDDLDHENDEDEDDEDDE